jgi:hypothetical protein
MTIMRRTSLATALGAGLSAVLVTALVPVASAMAATPDLVGDPA